MSESRRLVKFAPSIKFIVAVYSVEVSIGMLIVIWLLSRAAP